MSRLTTRVDRLERARSPFGWCCSRVAEHGLCLSSEKGTSLPTKKGATEIFLSTSRESSKSPKKAGAWRQWGAHRKGGHPRVLIEKETTSSAVYLVLIGRGCASVVGLAQQTGDLLQAGLRQGL